MAGDERRAEVEAVALGARVVIDKGTDCEQLARLWCPDAKWTADMRGMAVVQRIRPDGTVPSWAPKNGHLLIERRRLSVDA